MEPVNEADLAKMQMVLTEAAKENVCTNTHV